MPATSFDEVLEAVWRQALVENADAVKVGAERRPMRWRNGISRKVQKANGERKGKTVGEKTAEGRDGLLHPCILF
jgi:hypothetical protein